MAKPNYLIGVDGGGSKCKAIVYDIAKQTYLSTGLAGPANIALNLPKAKQAIIEACKLAIFNSGLSHLPLEQFAVGAGVAGANDPKAKQALLAWQQPFASLHVTTDLHIACYGAHNSRFGAAIILGTGSCGVSITENQSQDDFLMLGGHGFKLGDKGSGAWLGLHAVQHTLEVLDELSPASMLSQAVIEQSAPDAMQIYSQFEAANSAKFSLLAPLVFSAADQGDALATALLREAAYYINAMIKKLLATKPEGLTLLGGLAPLYLPWLDQTLVDQLSPAQNPPEYGAVFYAQQCQQANLKA
ncbi:ATPase [Saccharobesus litoralis]|uniref:ATPase n=1 Tax=Saccharobesus litoralis TaxID=2172099 RepID=A0A2S0VPY7_9ALTE|nr:BadF/BadG/BcrA/BcrD ATPase family protein [Saccharobesus litoralis]AWB66278.1 ATPase [Saccharobesus litoralis]